MSGSLRGMNVKIIDAGTNSYVAREIAKKLKVGLVRVETNMFANSETHARAVETVRGAKCFIVGSARNNNIDRDQMIIKQAINSVGNAEPDEMHLIELCFPYGRQENKYVQRDPLSLAIALRELVSCTNETIKSFITFDPHSASFESMAFLAGLRSATALTLKPLLLNEMMNTLQYNLNDLFFVPTDQGSGKATKKLAESYFGEDFINHMLLSMKIKDKSGTFIQLYHPFGKNIQRISTFNKRVVTVDDMFDRCGTALALGNSISRMEGDEPKSLDIAAVHGWFTDNSRQKLQDNPFISNVFVTNSIEIDNPYLYPKTHVVDCSSYVANIIKLKLLGKSLGDYFDYQEEKSSIIKNKPIIKH